MVSSMLSIRQRTSQSTVSTAAATFFRRGSGAVMMGSNAILIEIPGVLTRLGMRSGSRSSATYLRADGRPIRSS